MSKTHSEKPERSLFGDCDMNLERDCSMPSEHIHTNTFPLESTDARLEAKHKRIGITLLDRNQAMFH